MASETYSVPQSLSHLEVWPPDDTEESVVGTDLHQMTIMNLRWGINERAQALTPPGQPVPWQALSQTVVSGFERPTGTRYKTLPDVFVYRHPISQRRGSVAVAVDGPPVFIVEVLSESTYDVDLDLVKGKGFSYARAGVREYLALDPTGEFLPERVRAWRLEEGIYHPWEPDAQGRWQSKEIAVAIGLEGVLAAVYAPTGQRQLREGEVTREVARRDKELARRDEELARRDEELAALRQLVEQLKRQHE